MAKVIQDRAAARSQAASRADEAVPASPLAACDVVFVLPHLGPGGAQRVATLVANQWAAHGLKVVLITTLDNKEDAHRLDPAVVRVRLRDVSTPGGRPSRGTLPSPMMSVEQVAWSSCTVCA